MAANMAPRDPAEAPNSTLTLILSDLNQLPDELLLHILSFLDVPDLLCFSRLSHRLRVLSFDPLLHSSRLHRASFTIERYIPFRPSLAELMAHRIYITRTTLAARNLGRSLIKIKLTRQLLRRPSAEQLVEMGVLPRECYRRGKEGTWLAPSLVEMKRRVEKERIKDVLRGWVEEWRRKGWEKKREEVSETRPDVRRLARRFARDREVGDGRTGDTHTWGQPSVGGRREEPPRAKVLGLRRFWERIGREGATI